MHGALYTWRRGIKAHLGTQKGRLVSWHTSLNDFGKVHTIRRSVPRLLTPRNNSWGLSTWRVAVLSNYMFPMSLTIDAVLHVWRYSGISVPCPCTLWRWVGLALRSQARILGAGSPRKVSQIPCSCTFPRRVFCRNWKNVSFLPMWQMENVTIISISWLGSVLQSGAYCATTHT